MNGSLSQRSIGYRIKYAREKRGWSQDQLCEAMQIRDRQTISDIENWKRSVKPEEIVALSEIFDCPLDFFLDPFSLVGEAQYSFRATPGAPPKSIDDFEQKAGRIVGLFRWIRASSKKSLNPLKHTLKISLRSSYEEAQELAEGLVESLNLGDIPTSQIIERIESKLDIPILFVDIAESQVEAQISGVTAHTQDFTAILINRNESEARRYYNIAHELFHALTWDILKPEHREGNNQSNSKSKRTEQLADNFAAALLMPRQSLEKLIDHRELKNIEHLSTVAAQLRVSPSAFAYRLKNLGLINDETCSTLLSERQQKPSDGIPKRFSSSFIHLLYEAINRGRLSARKGAKTLDMDLDELADLFLEHGLTAPFAKLGASLNG